MILLQFVSLPLTTILFVLFGREDLRTANCIAGKGGVDCLVLDRE